MADVTYLGVTFGIQAKADGVTQPYKPAHWADIPEGLKDPQGNWFAIHSGTLGFMVNVDALRGKPVPQSWADLLKPEYKGLIGYLDPSSAFVGYVGAVAVNQALGGSLDNFAPAYKFFKDLQKNQPIVPKQTAYARVLSGEIPILLDYDFNAYRARYKDRANVAFVIPEGRLAGGAVRDEPGQQRAPPGRTAARCWTSCCPTPARRCGPAPTCARCATCRCRRTWKRASCRRRTTPAPSAVDFGKMAAGAEGVQRAVHEGSER